MVKISPDSTFLAVGHVSGNFFLWELAKPNRPARTVLALSEEQLVSGRKDGHLAGDSILHIDFCGARHTSVVTGDETGKAFWWSLGRVFGVESTDVVRILGSDRRNSTLHSVVSLGTDSQLVALLTPVKMVVVALKPEPKTLYRKTRSFSDTGCAVWNGTTLAFAWQDTIHLLSGACEELGTVRLQGQIRSMAWHDRQVWAVSLWLM